MNTSDPIVPGISAAGIRIGEQIAQIPDAEVHAPVDRFNGIEKYVFEAVTVWARHGHVDQIGLRAPYSGRLASGIGIGDTIGEVERAFGPVTEDDDDNLVVRGSAGWCFETDDWVGGRSLGANREARISEIFVFAPVAAADAVTLGPLGDEGMPILREYDVVRVVRLVSLDRFYDGTESVMRAPRIGDVATICHENKPGDPSASVVVEMVDQDGMTIWLADFARDELELVSQP